ncbi:MAG: SPOR domain-containing protein [Candidatus Marinimicrobia bacterium]|nr:SPOR domain-containing protein [Candidatus Neomarinimicrobiota bacterium]
MGKTRLINTMILLMALIIGIPVSSLCQDVDGLLTLVHQGKLDSAETVLSELSFKHPGHPGLRYARALMQTDALLAAGLYKDIVRNHSRSQYMAGALMHLGEYYYAQGLYVQSRQFFLRLIRFHPDYSDIVNAVNLSLRAGIASRQMDSVYIDLADITERFPNTSFDIPEELDITRIPARAKLPVESDRTQPLITAPLRGLGEGVVTSTNQPKGEYTLQAGAFGDYNNARRLADQIESIGYTTTIKERISNGKTLYLIMVGDFSDRTAAMSVSDMLEAALGIPSFPVAIN